MKTLKEYYVVDKEGKIVGKKVGLRAAFRLAGLSHHPSGLHFNNLESEGYCKANGFYISPVDGVRKVQKMVRDARESEKSSELGDLIKGVLEQKCVLVLEEDLKITGVYNYTLATISEIEGFTVANVKTKLHKDKKIIRDILTKGYIEGRVKSKRLIYLHDYIDIINLLKLRDEE